MKWLISRWGKLIPEGKGGGGEGGGGGVLPLYISEWDGYLPMIWNMRCFPCQQDWDGFG